MSGMLVYRSGESTWTRTGRWRDFFWNRYLRVAPGIYAFAVVAPLILLAAGQSLLPISSAIRLSCGSAAAYFCCRITTANLGARRNWRHQRTAVHHPRRGQFLPDRTYPRPGRPAVQFSGDAGRIRRRNTGDQQPCRLGRDDSRSSCAPLLCRASRLLRCWHVLGEVSRQDPCSLVDVRLELLPLCPSEAPRAEHRRARSAFAVPDRCSTELHGCVLRLPRPTVAWKDHRSGWRPQLQHLHLACTSDQPIALVRSG